MSTRKFRVIIENAILGVISGSDYYGSYSVRMKSLTKGSIIEKSGSFDMDGVPVQCVVDQDGDSGTFWPNDAGDISRFVEEIE